MPAKRPPADKPTEPTDPPSTTGDDQAVTDTPPAASKAAGDESPVTETADATEPAPPADASEPEPPAAGVYRFDWPYPCTYLLPDRTSKAVETGEEVFWPNGAPDALWEFVSDEPAPAPSDNTPRE